MALHHIAVVGATGNIGPAIVNGLLEHKDYFTSITAVTASSPDDAKFAELKAKGVHVVQAKFDDKHSLVHAFKGIDAVVSTVGGAIIGQQILFIDAAIEAGVKRFLPSEFGLDHTLPANTHEPVLSGKVKVHQHLEEAAKLGKITYTIVPTGGFADWGLTSSFIGFDIKNHEATFFDEGRHHFGLIQRSDIGKYVAAVLRHPEISANKILRFTGFLTNQLEIFQTLEKFTGKKWTIKAKLVSSEVRKTGLEAQAKGDYVTWIVSTIQAIYLSGGSVFVPDNYLFPDIRPQTLDEVVAGVVGDHRHH